MEIGKMAAAASSNRFMPLSSSTSPRSPYKCRNPSPTRSNASARSRNPSPSRSDASQQSRSPSPSPSEVSQLYRSIASRIATYPESWTYDGLSPQLLASCGLCYYTEFDEDACVCRECMHYATIPMLKADKDYSPDNLLGRHAEACLLADILFDLLENPSYLHKPTSALNASNSHPAKTPLPKELCPLEHIDPTQEPPSKHATTTHLPVLSKSTPTLSPPLSPRLASPTKPSYATIVSRPAPTPLLTPSKPPRPLTSSLAHKNTISIPIIMPTISKTT
ncbi:hypothetical protein BGZ57DRAFT_919336 [Hyaloscypha finlandica]|nr:hypothetical protein BGZ57DRAFT_919336 [Hyaloscypha finlandica]